MYYYVAVSVGDSGEIQQGKGPSAVGQDQVPGTGGADNESICHHHQVTTNPTSHETHIHFMHV